MIIDSKYAKIFNSDMLTRSKYDELYAVAVNLRDFRNEVSQLVNNNLLYYLDFNKFDFITEMRKHFSSKISSCFDKQAYERVYTDYQNKFNAILRNIEFKKIKFKGFELYKKNSKKHKKGDLKQIITEISQTNLTLCLSYLARYGKKSTLEYLKQKVKELSDSTDKKEIKRRELYQNILDKCAKFGFDRLFRLALSRRNRTITHYSEHPIEYKSLTFGGRSRKQRIIEFNRNYNSEINAFVSLSGFSKSSFDIPVKYSKYYHGRIKSYRKNSNDYEYLIKFDEYRKQVSIIYAKDGERYIPEAKDELIGIDVNSKHNLFSLSNGESYDFDRKLLEDFCVLSLKIDDLKSKNKNYEIGKRKQRKLDTLKNKINKYEENLIASVCKHLSEQGYHHVVMEKLDNSFGKCFVNDEHDVNYNRRVNFLGLSSIKDKFDHIGRKYDIAVSLVHPHYTSKQCPICGCIEDDNRKCQEAFKCVQCGYEANADFNAALNIQNRVSITVLCHKLLKRSDNGTYLPKPMKRGKVKEVLLSFRNNVVKHSEVYNC
jgi:transposase